LIQRFQLYTISRDGRLFRLNITRNHVKPTLIAKLGRPFGDRNVRTEGLAMAPDGALYAAVVFVSKAGTNSRLYRISPRSGSATFVGEIAAAEVDGLDFRRDGKLYGAISSGSRTLALGLRQIVTINTTTGHPSPTVNEVTFGDLDALAFDSAGNALVTNGRKGLFSIDLMRKHKFSHVFTDPEFRRLLRANDEMEGLCITSEGVVFGLCHEERTFLVRLDPKAKRVTRIGDLGFGALCLATEK
jgi:sugar lactone lactonase YvrE